MKSKSIIPAFVLFATMVCHGQSNGKEKYPNFYAGIGLGLDYGGIGFKAEFLPVKSIGIFAGAGANLDKVGLNGGLSWKILPDKKVTPTLMAMYGYNAVLKVKSAFGNAVVFQKTYYGPSAGAGCEIKTGKNSNKWSIAVIVPFRSQAFNDKYNEYKEAGFEFKPGKTPVLFSIGYNLNSSGKKYFF
jgi:hypothetical protein